MKKEMFLALFVFAVLSVSACASKQASVQTGPVANDRPMSVFMDYGQYSIGSETGNDQEWVTVHFITLNRPASTKEVLQYMEERKLQPAKVEYLATVDKRYSDLKKEYVLVALGSLWPSRTEYILGPSNSFFGPETLEQRWLGTIIYGAGKCRQDPCWNDSNYYSKFLFLAIAK